jgi:hypothetical protein
MFTGMWGWLRKRGASAARWPVLVTFPLAALLFVIGEQYPFSPFPMYQDFESKAFYVWISDEAGHRVALLPTFGLRAGALKKTFETKLREVRAEASPHKSPKGKPTQEQQRHAGEAALAWMVAQSGAHLQPSVPGGLRLMKVEVELKDGRLSETTSELARR